MELGLSPAIDAIGWSLIHFLWQGTAIAVVLALVLRALGKRSSHLRYGVIGVTFIVMLGSFGATFFHQCEKAAAVEASSDRSIPGAIAEAGRVGESRSGESFPSPAGKDTSTAGERPTGLIVYPLSIPPDAGNEAKDARWFLAPERIRVMLPWIVALWVAGVVVFSLRALSGMLHLRVCLGSGEEPKDPAWRERFAALCEGIRVSRPVRLLASAAVPVPIVVGWLKPTVLVPVGLFAQLPVYQLEAILAHELAHIRRHDFPINLLQNVTETVFFFHPAIWWVSAQLRKEREHCCDDVAADQCGSAIEFARALTALEEICTRAAPPVAVAATDGPLLGRIRRLLGAAPPESGSVCSWPAGMIIFLLVAGIAAGAHFVQGAPDAEAPVVHGYSLVGVPSVSNSVAIPELREDPFFTMPVEADGGGPDLIYPVGNEKPHFYLRFPDRTYGPIEGDPVKRMNLTRVLREQIHSLDEKAATTRLREMLELGDTVMLEASYQLIPELKNYDHRAIAAILREGIYAQPTSTVLARKGAVALAKVNDAFHKAVRDDARERWEAMRVEIPESEYVPGELPEDFDDLPIQWGETNEAGLRLGVSVAGFGDPVPVGRNLDFRIFIRNDGQDALRFTPPGTEGAGFYVMLVHESGWGMIQEPGLKRSIERRVRLAPGQVYSVRLAPTQTILYNEVGVPTARKLQPTAWVVRPGRYWIELDFQVGVFDVHSDWGELEPETIPGLGEWTGILPGEPMEIEFAPPEVRTARPGDSVVFSDQHRLEFKEESINLFHSPGVSDEPVSDVWRLKEFPESDYQISDRWKSGESEGRYLAAWDAGGTRVWIRQGDEGVQCLEFQRAFCDGGRWTMRQSMDHLGYMPDGVRTALNLPPRLILRAGYQGGKVAQSE